MCTKIMEASGKINMDEYNFFLRGGVVLDREEQMDNPCSNWLSDAAWDNVTELDKWVSFFFDLLYFLSSEQNTFWILVSW